MKISKDGIGYKRLVKDTCFAETGNDIICFDIDESEIYNAIKTFEIFETTIEQERH